VAYFMASTDTAEDNRAFAEKNEASFPVLADPDKTTAAAYGVLADSGYARRWTFYIDGEGIIRRIDKAVDPRTAGADLVRNLESLGVPAAP
jgi:peroxiredoxin Q/BCP